MIYDTLFIIFFMLKILDFIFICLKNILEFYFKMKKMTYFKELK